MRILVIEDNRRLATGIGTILQSVGLAVDYCYDGVTGFEQSLVTPYALLILDVMLPGMDGYTVAKELRSSHCDTPILMLTAKTDVADRVEGLNSGADYYLTKPFHVEELLSCVKALLRRQGIEAGTLAYGNTTLELTTAILRCGTKTVRLSAKEFQILELLLKGKRRIITKEYLLTAVWGYDAEIVENTVEVYVSMLRKKLKAVGSNVQIEAVFRMGYHLVVMDGR